MWAKCTVKWRPRFALSARDMQDKKGFVAGRHVKPFRNRPSISTLVSMKASWNYLSLLFPLESHQTGGNTSGGRWTASNISTWPSLANTLLQGIYD